MSSLPLGGRSRSLLALALAIFLSLTSAQFAFAQEAGADGSGSNVFSGDTLAGSASSGTPSPTGATIASDKADYGPGEMVYLTGSGWQPGESVRIVVNDDGLQEQPWQRDVTLTADAAGNIADSFELAVWFVANYTVTATGEQSGTATTAFTDTINGVAFVDKTDNFRAKNGQTYTFTVTNTSTAPGATLIESVRIDPPVSGGTFLFTSCSVSRPAWTAQLQGSNCEFRNNGSPGNPIPVGGTQTFTVTTNISPGDDVVAPIGWVGPIRLSPNQANLGGANSAQPAFTGALAINLFAFEVTDAVISTATPPPGTACPAANKTAPAGSTRNIVICGRAGTAVAPQPLAANSSLGGTMIGTAGAFTSATVPPLTPVPIVLARYDGTTITSSAGTGKTVVAKIGSAANRTSPLTTFNDYEATVSCTNASVTTHPSNQSITYGANATFTAAGGGSPAPSVQWQVSTDGGGNWNNLAGETNTTLTLTKPGVSMSGNRYRAVFTNNCNGTKTATTNEATLAVSAKNLTVDGAVADGKTYDGTTAATVDFSGASLVGVVGTEDVSIDSSGYAAEFDDKNVGEDKPVTVTGVALGGADAGNYTVSQPSGLTADIEAKNLTASAIAQNKVYDGTTAATVTLSAGPNEIVSGDDVTLNHTTAVFANKNVGTWSVTVSGISLDGADKGNYNLTNTIAITTAAITAKNLTIDGAVANNKVYDGNKTATVNFGGASLVGVVGTEDVSIDSTNYAAEFDDKDVGTNKPVTVTGVTLGGADNGNYTVSQPTGLKANITAWNAQGSGFYEPVGVANSIFRAAPLLPPTEPGLTLWHTAKGGSTIPLKFNVYAGTVEKTSTSDISAFTQKGITCGASVGTDEVDIVSTGATSLRYDTTGHQFIQNWKTPSVTKETCYRATVTFADGSSLSAFFKLRK
jgi:YDG domain